MFIQLTYKINGHFNHKRCRKRCSILQSSWTFQAQKRVYFTYIAVLLLPRPRLARRRFPTTGWSCSKGSEVIKKICLWFCVCLLFVLSILFFFFSSLSLSLCIKDQTCFQPYLCPHHLGNRNASQLLGENIFLLPVKRWTGPGRLRILNPATGPCNLHSLVHVMSMFHLVRTRTCFLQHLVQCYDLGSEGFSSLQPDICFTKMKKQ